MDCAGAQNAVSHRGTLLAKATVPPHKLALLHHLSPRGPGMWSWSYECEWHVATADDAPGGNDDATPPPDAGPTAPFTPTLSF